MKVLRNEHHQNARVFDKQHICNAPLWCSLHCQSAFLEVPAMLHFIPTGFVFQADCLETSTFIETLLSII